MSSTSRLKAIDSLNTFHFEFEEKFKDNPQPYRMQGSAAFEEAAIKKQRELIGQSQRLKSVALQFWTSSGLSESQNMPKDTYTFIHRRISKALAPELTDDEATDAADEDWEEDSCGAESMEFEKYAKGLFGIADMWTDKVDELEYVIFLNKLFRRITILREGRGGTPQGAPGFKAAAAFASAMAAKGDFPFKGAAAVQSSSDESSPANQAAAGKPRAGSVLGRANSLFAAAKASLGEVQPSATLPPQGSSQGAGGSQGGELSKTRPSCGSPPAVGTPGSKPRGIAGAREGLSIISSAAATGASTGASPAASQIGSTERPRTGSAERMPGGPSAASLNGTPPGSRGSMSSARNSWRGLLPSFRAFRELDEIIPLAEPTKIKPPSNASLAADVLDRYAMQTSAKKPSTSSKRSRKKSTDDVGAALGREGFSPSGNADGGGAGGGGGSGPGPRARRLSKELQSKEEKKQAARTAGAAAAARRRRKGRGSGDADDEGAGGGEEELPSTPAAANSKQQHGMPPPRPAEVGTIGASVSASVSSSPLTSPPPMPLITPSDDEDDEETKRELMASAPRSSFSLKRRGEAGWVDAQGMAIRTPRQMLRNAGKMRNAHFAASDSPAVAAPLRSSGARASRNAHFEYSLDVTPRNSSSLSGSSLGLGSPFVRSPFPRSPKTPRSQIRAASTLSRQRMGRLSSPYFKGMQINSPARPEGGTQSDGEEEVQERRSLLSRALMAAQAPREPKPAGGDAKKAAPVRTLSGAIDRAYFGYQQPLSDDEDDAAYAAMRPAVMQAKRSFLTGRAREGGAGGGGGGGGGDKWGAALRAAQRRRYGGDGSSEEGDSEDSEVEREMDEQEEMEEEQRLKASAALGVKPADGWGAEPLKRRSWWRVREKTRKEEIRQDSESEAAAMERRRAELLRKKLSLMQPLPRLGNLSPLTSGTGGGGEAAAAAGGAATAGAPPPSPGGRRLSSPKEFVQAALGMLPRRRRFTHDGTNSFGEYQINNANLKDATLDAAARAVLERPSSADAASPEARVPGGMPEGWGRPVNLAGPNVTVTRPAAAGLAASLGGSTAQRVALGAGVGPSGSSSGMGSKGQYPPVGSVDVRR